MRRLLGARAAPRARGLARTRGLSSEAARRVRVHDNTHSQSDCVGPYQVLKDADVIALRVDRRVAGREGVAKLQEVREGHHRE